MATLDQDPPADTSTYYDVVNTTKFVNVIYLATRQLNDENDSKNVQWRIDYDGVSATYGTASHLHNTWYYWYIYTLANEVKATTSIINAAYYATFKARSFRARLRIATAVGTNQELDARIQYAIRKEV